MNEEKNIPIEDENLEEQAEELKPEEEAEVQEEAAAQEEPAEEAAEPEEKAAEPEKGTEEDPRDKKIEELNAKYMRLISISMQMKRSLKIFWKSSITSRERWMLRKTQTPVSTKVWN